MVRMKFVVLGAIAALSITCFEPPAALAQSPTYQKCAKACSRGDVRCQEKCEIAENARNAKHVRPGTIIMKCTTDPRTHEQNCHQ